MWLSGLSAILRTGRLQVWFQSGQMPGLRTRSPVGGAWETTTHWCFSPFLSPLLSKNKIFLKEISLNTCKPKTKLSQSLQIWALVCMLRHTFNTQADYNSFLAFILRAEHEGQPEVRLEGLPRSFPKASAYLPGFSLLFVFCSNCYFLP